MQLPREERIAQIDPAWARETVRSQIREYRQTFINTSAQSPPAVEPSAAGIVQMGTTAARSDRLALRRPADTRLAALDFPDRAAAQIAISAALAEAQARIDELTSVVAKLREMIGLRDRQIADLMNFNAATTSITRPAAGPAGLMDVSQSQGVRPAPVPARAVALSGAAVFLTIVVVWLRKRRDGDDIGHRNSP